jgi:hypothetical protein
LGHEYLKYVLWAISPEGPPVNIGEVLVGDNHRSKLYVTTDLQPFAMIVTAEPYYALRRPSNLVVLENVVRPDTRGSEQRAQGVRTYLTQLGVPESSTTAAGFGKSRPIASHETSEGRQQNRRVELVVSGEVIGTKIVSLSLQPVADATITQ